MNAGELRLAISLRRAEGEDSREERKLGDLLGGETCAGIGWEVHHRWEVHHKQHMTKT